MGVDKSYGSPKAGKATKPISPRAASAALRQKNMQIVAAKLSKAGKPLSGAQMAALGIGAGLAGGAALLIGGGLNAGRGGGGTGLPSSNKTK